MLCRSKEELEALEKLFSFSFDHDDDVDKHHRLRMDGTCAWIFEETQMFERLNATDGCHLIWFSAAPASGKSVLSAHMVKSLRERGLFVQMFLLQLRRSA